MNDEHIKVPSTVTALVKGYIKISKVLSVLAKIIFRDKNEIYLSIILIKQSLGMTSIFVFSFVMK